MSHPGDIFDPSAVLAAIQEVECSSISARRKFKGEWMDKINKRTNSWKQHKDNAGTPRAQLEFESAIVEYVTYLHKKLPIHRKAGLPGKFAIDKNIPILGPRFLPRTYMHAMRREVTPAITPEMAYIKPLTVVHAIFYPTALTNKCPQCRSTSVSWDSWNGTGARDVYGICINERALGYQMRCQDCAEHGKTHCFVTTNRAFWENWEPWRIPKTIPIFFKRAAVSHELYDLIAEIRISSTSAGLAEHIKQLHLKEYHTRHLEYLQHFEAAHSSCYSQSKPLALFSSPTDPNGYNDAPITNDFVSVSYLHFVFRTRQAESMHYCKTRSAVSISVDNTFKSASKATVVGKDGRRESPMTGGILSAINELSEGLGWRYCMSASPIEIQELLTSIAQCTKEQARGDILSVTADNCCSIRRFVEEALGPDVKVCLDVFHFIQRYAIVVHGGTKNPFCREVLASIKNSIIKPTESKKRVPAIYWSKEEQEVRIVDAYNRWLQQGGIWSAAAPKAHAYQLEHVRKGCLARPDNVDVAFDGSRIEGSHKGWNSLQRAHPSGIEIYTSLGHDHIHRRNIRIGTSKVENKGINLPEFIRSLYGSHHVHLVDYNARLFNLLISKLPANKAAEYAVSPLLPDVRNSEPFGLTKSNHWKTYGGLIKEADDIENLEPESVLINDAFDPLLDDADPDVNDAAREFLIRTIGIEEGLIWDPLRERMVSVPGNKRKQGEHQAELTVDPMEEAGGANTPNPKRRRIADSTVHEIHSDHLLPGALSGSGAATAINCDPSADVVLRDSDDLPPSGTSGSEVLRASYAFMPAAISGPSNSTGTRQSVQEWIGLPSPGPHNNTTLHSSNKEPAGGSPVLTLDMLQRPLPLPPALRVKGLTRSQVLFSLGTTVDPRTLSINTDTEFFLFMDMRKENQWTTFGMSNERWALATQAYNSRMDAIAKEKRLPYVKKSPQALQKKLAIIEDKIIARIARNDYKSSKSNTETFWRKHCDAVPSLRVKAEAWKAANAGNGDKMAGDGNQKKLPRKTPACSRCANISLNHRKGWCSDGAPQRAKPGSIDASIPMYPQPPGIFAEGKKFNPANLLTALRDFYGRIVEYETLKNKSETTPFESDKILEDRAFSQMLEERVKVIGPHSYFLLYDGLELELTSSAHSPDFDLISEMNGRRYLRLDCLQNTI